MFFKSLAMKYSKGSNEWLQNVGFINSETNFLWKMLAALGWTQAVRIIILNVLAPVPQGWMGLYISHELLQFRHQYMYT